MKKNTKYVEKYTEKYTNFEKCILCIILYYD